MGPAITLVVGAYLVGSLPFGVWLARARGFDLQRSGSGNTGATNVGRVVGKSWGFLVLSLDAAKGALPCVLALQLAPAVAPYAGLAAILGHVFSPFLRFRGGKGVATSAGVFGVLSPLALGVALAGFGLGWLCVRAVGFGSLVAAGAMALFVWLRPHPLPLRVVVSVIAALILIRHLGNIRRGFREPPQDSGGGGVEDSSSPRDEGAPPS